MRPNSAISVRSFPFPYFSEVFEVADGELGQGFKVAFDFFDLFFLALNQLVGKKPSLGDRNTDFEETEDISSTISVEGCLKVLGLCPVLMTPSQVSSFSIRR